MKSAWVRFEEVGTSDSGKTKIWEVHERAGGGLLGVINWYARWRQYCFLPESETIWNHACLTDVSEFIKLKMQERSGKVSA